MGADAGFASIIGLAILVLLYFAQARETASLREQAELAAQRLAQLESRLAHAAAAQPLTVAPAPAGIQPRPGVVPAPGFQPAPPIVAVSPAPPAGVAAPPLSAATKLIPTGPGIAGIAAARITGAGRPLPAASTAVGPAGVAPVSAAPAGAAPAGAAPAGATPAAGSPAPAGANPAAGAPAPAGAAPSSPPFAAPGASVPPANPIVTPRPATAAGGATGTNGTGEHPVMAPPPIPSRPPVQIRPGGGGGGGGRGGARPGMLADLGGHGDSPSDLTRVLTALAAVAVVAAIVIVLLSVTSGGTTARTNASLSTPTSNAPTVTHHRSTPKTPAFSPASVTVAVLNGTAVYHLANSIGMQLAADGFKNGTITNASTQTQPNTTVEYGAGYQRAAAAVARALKLSSSAVQPVTTATQQTLGCTTQTASCTVVVTVGQDLVPSTQTTTTG